MSTIQEEIKKEQNVLLFDFGTLFIKSSVMENGEFNEYNAVIRNQIFFLSPEKAQRIQDDSKGRNRVYGRFSETTGIGGRVVDPLPGT